mmetsp:Transcript_11855/g.16827  ORF Transcript_11855/g.16827 Transcript_11855/m.16827 type:complete len:204 (+) Transcript_11855:122-733(+)
MVLCCNRKKKVEDEEEEDEEENIGVFKLKKNPKAKGKKKKASGLSWRNDPCGVQEDCENPMNNFPRDNAVIEGYRFSIDGERWVRALYVRQADSAKWLEAPPNAYVPWEYEKAYTMAKLKGKGPTMIEIEEKELEEEEEEKKRRGCLGKCCPCCFKKKKEEEGDGTNNDKDGKNDSHGNDDDDNDDDDIENNRTKPSEEKKDE